MSKDFNVHLSILGDTCNCSFQGKAHKKTCLFISMTDNEQANISNPDTLAFTLALTEVVVRGAWEDKCAQCQWQCGLNSFEHTTAGSPEH